MRISRVFYVFRPTCICRGTIIIIIITPVPFSRGGQKMANPVREMNTVADGRKGDPQQDVEGKKFVLVRGFSGKRDRFFIKGPSSYA